MTFYTDGACSGNPGPGGWAYVSIQGNQIEASSFGFEEDTTNNRMELKAILNVFKYIYEQNKSLENEFTKEQYEIVSDSAYAINSITLWSLSWARNAWTRSKGKNIENLDLIQSLYDYYITKNLQSQVTFSKVHGHCGILGNELCDAICSKNKSKYNSLIKKYNLDDSIMYEVNNAECD